MNFHQNSMRPINIVLFGRTGSGKSSLGNFLSGGQEVFEVGKTLHSKTSFATSHITSLPGFPHIRVKIVDTPGFADNRSNMSQEQLLGNILCFLKELGEGFHLGIYCIPAVKNRIDDHDIQEVKLMGKLFGQGIFEHTLIAVTQANMLIPEERKRVYAKFPIDLPRILSIPQIDPDSVLFADSDNFQEMFVKPLVVALKNTTVYQPEISKDIDPTNPESIKRALAKPEMQEFMKEYETILENQKKQIAESHARLEQQAAENRALQQKSFEAQERYQSTLDYLKQQIEQSHASREDLEAQFGDYQQKQKRKVDEMNTQIAAQTDQMRRYQVEMDEKEKKILALQKQAEDLHRTREAAVAASRTIEGKDGKGDIPDPVLKQAFADLLERICKNL